MKPLIHIIVNSFNRNELLTRAVQSALAQTYENIRIIIIDDASEVPQDQFLGNELKDSRVTFIGLNENLNAYRTRNLAILLSGYADAIMFLDSDDTIEPQTIEEMAKQAFTIDGYEVPRRSNIDIVCILTKKVFLDGTEEIFGTASNLASPFLNIWSDNPNDRHLRTICSLYKTHTFEQAGVFLSIPISADDDLRNRFLLSKFRFFVINEPYYTQFLQTDSLTQNKQTGFKTDARRMAWEVIKAKRQLMLEDFPDSELIRSKYREQAQFPTLSIGNIINPQNLSINPNIPVTEISLKKVMREFTEIK